MRAQAVVDRIEIERDGTIGIRFAKEIVADDGTVLHSAWHRTAVAPGDDVDAQMAAASQHLQAMKYGAVEAKEVARVKQAATAFQTSEVVTKYQAARAAEQLVSEGSVALDDYEEGVWTPVKER